MEHPEFINFTNALRKLLPWVHSPNGVTWTLQFSDLGQWVVTVHKASGRNPTEYIEDLQRRLRDAEDALEAEAKKAERLGQDLDVLRAAYANCNAKSESA